jgi:transcriptional regulator with XRE-family HTH domain
VTATQNHHPGMTAEELTTRREQLGLTQAGLARMLGVPALTVWKWEHANQAVPALMEMALRGVEVTLQQHPPPRIIRRRPATPTIPNHPWCPGSDLPPLKRKEPDRSPRTIRNTQQRRYGKSQCSVCNRWLVARPDGRPSRHKVDRQAALLPAPRG